MKKTITMLLVFSVLAFMSSELKAQKDGYFYEVSPDMSTDIRDFTVEDMAKLGGVGFNSLNSSINSFNFGKTNEGGLGFTNIDNGAPIGNGLFIMAGLAALRLASKSKRKTQR